MKRRNVRASASLVFVLIMATVVWLNAGDLNPPVGPVAPTHKTLTEVEPRIAINATNTPGDIFYLFKITQPGSYYLTGNITGVGFKNGIGIAASGVTVDLNGFDLLGVPVSGDGVTVTASGLSNIAVVNGSVRNWGNKGVDLGIFFANNCRVANLLASGNNSSGIVTWNGSTVSNCSAYNNTGHGIIVEFHCTVSNCSAFGNNTNGIVTDVGGMISNCSAGDNLATGIFAGSGSTISNCSASSNLANGIQSGNGSTVVDCTARANLRGIVTGDDCSITGGTVQANAASGIDAGARCAILKTAVSGTITGPGVIADAEGLRIEGSSINNNSTFGVVVDTASDVAELAVVNCTIRGNGSAGISSEASTQVLDSIVSSNGTTGIILTSSGFIRGCTITSNTSSGVELLTNANVVMNNTLTSNAPSIASAAGILVQGTDNTIDGNRLFSNAQGGIKVNSAGNLVLRNYLARTGATITAVAGNSVAQTIASPAAGFVSTDPNANYTY